MSDRPLHRCLAAGCRVLTRETRCPLHSKGASNPKNKSGDPFYTGRPWRRLREQFLQANPLCGDCLKEDRVAVAVEVHHKKPRREYPELAYEITNLEGLCKPHHSKRTAEEKRTRAN